MSGILFGVVAFTFIAVFGVARTLILLTAAATLKIPFMIVWKAASLANEHLQLTGMNQPSRAAEGAAAIASSCLIWLALRLTGAGPAAPGEPAAAAAAPALSSTVPAARA